MVEVSVCIGSSCHLKGSYNVIQAFQQMIEENGLHDKARYGARILQHDHSSARPISEGKDW